VNDPTLGQTVSTPDVSFVIPVRNDAVRLRKCLASIHANDYPIENVEIIVVDNGSSDGSRIVASDAGTTVLSAPDQSVAQLRNMGAAAARSGILAFVDADHVLGSEWIRTAVDVLGRNPAFGAVGALYHAPEDGTWVQRAYDRLRGRRVGNQPVEWLGAGNMAVRREAFERVGGFDPSLVTCEDVDLCKRLRAAGFGVMADDRLVTVHRGDPATLGALFRGELWRGRGNLAVSFRAPITVRELPSAIAPVVQLIGLALALSAFVINGRAALLLATLGLAPIALLPILRAARMSWPLYSVGVRQLADNVVVAFVYDLARALALVVFADYSARRQSGRPTNA